jgi:hypothetical protein
MPVNPTVHQEESIGEMDLFESHPDNPGFGGIIDILTFYRDKLGLLQAGKLIKLHRMSRI